jgi:hypothetical protein
LSDSDAFTDAYHDCYAHAYGFTHADSDYHSDANADAFSKSWRYAYHHPDTVAMEFLELRQAVLAAPMAFKTRQQIWHHCMSQMQTGDCALEFGVWYGTSINWMANTRPDNVFHGFDSFEGLPEDWIRGHPKGHFKVDRSKLKFAPNVVLHEGLFGDTIPAFLAENGNHPIKFIHIDCDLGSSCDTVLELLEKRIAGCLLLFDEFYNYLGYEDHEFRSFLDFINRTGAGFEIVGRNVNHQQVLIQMKP